MKIDKKGLFKIYADLENQSMFLVSPLSGSYNYVWDEANEFWKSPI